MVLEEESGRTWEWSLPVLCPSPSSSSSMSNWKRVEGAGAVEAVVEVFALSFMSWLEKEDEGEMGIMEWNQSRLSSRVSRISAASGYTKSAHVSHSG